MLSFIKRLEILPEMQGEIASHLRCHGCGKTAFTRVVECKELCQKCHWQHEYDKRNIETILWLTIKKEMDRPAIGALADKVVFKKKGMNVFKKFTIDAMVEQRPEGVVQTVTQFTIVSTEGVTIKAYELSDELGAEVHLKSMSRSNVRLQKV